MKLPTVSGGSGPRFLRHTGVAAPLLRADMDCDVIAPLDTNLISGLSSGQRAFEPLRYLSDGSENPDFELNQEPYRSASILLVGENFGTGSAPESAVTRLMSFGIRAIVGPSFGSKFHAVCIAYGVLPVTLVEERTAALAARVESNPGVEMTIDLEAEVIEYADEEPVAFSVDPRARHKLLMGLNDLDEMSQHTENTLAFRSADRSRRPWIYDLKKTGGDGPAG